MFFLMNKFEPTSSPSSAGSPIEYVIITTDELVLPFETLAKWKIEKGIPAVVKTITCIENNYQGSDLAEKVRNFLKDAYSEWV